MTNKEFDDLGKIVDDSTTHVTVPTPEGWQCSKENCTVDWFHTHGTYPSLS